MVEGQRLLKSSYVEEHTQKDAPPLFQEVGRLNLATSYFRGAYRPTIIGATAFHFRVRNGNGWYHCAMVTRRRFMIENRNETYV